MRPRVVMLLAFVIAAVAVGFTGARFTLLPVGRPPTVHASLPADRDSYLGVFEAGSPPGYEPVAEFAQAAGRQPNLVEYYSGWAEPFQTSYAQMIRKHGVIPFVQIDPTFASVSGIAAGNYDIYLRLFADSVRDFGHPVVIGFGHEMNAPWYSWGYGNTSPSTFIAAWQHIVTLVPRPGRRQRHLAVDTPGGSVWYRAGRVLVAWRQLRQLGRHRRLLHSSLRYLRQGLRPDH